MVEEKVFIPAEILFAAVSEQLADGREASFTVTGNSMWPLLRHGRDQVIVETVQKEKLRVGDIVLFHASETKFLLHRIHRLSDNYFETTGDGNLFRDGQFPYDCILARVDKVIRKGKMIDCDNWRWRLLFRGWLSLFPVRRYIFRLWSVVRKYRKKG